MDKYIRPTIVKMISYVVRNEISNHLRKDN